MAAGSSGHGVRTTWATSRPAARTASTRQQGVVDRSQLGIRDDDDRQPDVASEVADQVVEPERHEEAADALADEEVPRLARPFETASRGAPVRSRSPRAPRPGEVRRQARTDTARSRRPFDSEPAAMRSCSWSGGTSSALASSRPLTAGLKTDTRAPRSSAVRAMTPATTVFPTSVPVPVTNTPSTAALGRVAEDALRTRERARAREPRLADHPGGPLWSSSARWLAITVRRRRDVPSGTVGGLIACAKTPPSSDPLAQRRGAAGVADHDRDDLRSRLADVEVVARPAPSASPRRSGEGARLPPAATRAGRARPVAAPTDGGGGAVEKMNGRARLMR